MAKRKDLEVGQEWAWTSTRDHRYASKVVILDTAPHQEVTHWRRANTIQKTEIGKGVLVQKTVRSEERQEREDGEVVWTYGTKEVQHVALLQHLVMPWAKYVKESEAKDASEARRREYEEQQRLYKQTIHEPALATLLKILLKVAREVKPNTWQIYDYSRIRELDTEVVKHLTEILHKHHLSVDPEHE
jgi:hypothetical protein